LLTLLFIDSYSFWREAAVLSSRNLEASYCGMRTTYSLGLSRHWLECGGGLRNPITAGQVLCASQGSSMRGLRSVIWSQWFSTENSSQLPYD